MEHSKVKEVFLREAPHEDKNNLSVHIEIVNASLPHLLMHFLKCTMYKITTVSQKQVPHTS